MGIYLHVDGIEGSAEHDNHKQWIEIDGLDFSIDRHIGGVAGAISNREGVQPEFSALRFNKRYDKSSLKLKQLAASGLASKKVEIHFVTTGNPGETYLEITLSDALLSSYRMSGGIG
ncbi:MAG: type VI secretion system tube protein Hcp, partial [Brucellaceae bacterium]|nr:type VI secretion system tube protein Hcp [Brucellaceae bacterium]